MAPILAGCTLSKLDSRISLESPSPGSSFKVLSIVTDPANRFEACTRETAYLGTPLFYALVTPRLLGDRVLGYLRDPSYELLSDPLSNDRLDRRFQGTFEIVYTLKLPVFPPR